MKIGVFVGTFDPIHIGHLNLIHYINDKQIVDKVYVIPTGSYWDKNHITDLSIRLEMLELIKDEKTWIKSEYSHYPYTYQILEALEKENPQDEFHLIIGADNANCLDKWKKYQEILKRKIIVANRIGQEVILKGENVILLNQYFGDVSSTMIRENPVKSKILLPLEVYQYILDKKLYQS